MNKIIFREDLAQNVVKLVVDAPLIAAKRKAGQFIILRTKAQGSERVPLTIADADPVKGTLTLVFQVVGKSTAELAPLNNGDSINDLGGPLCKHTDL